MHSERQTKFLINSVLKHVCVQAKFLGEFGLIMKRTKEGEEAERTFLECRGNTE
jgi:hypothetical protein